MLPAWWTLDSYWWHREMLELQVAHCCELPAGSIKWCAIRIEIINTVIRNNLAPVHQYGFLAAVECIIDLGIICKKAEPMTQKSSKKGGD